jgi:hypothetical protein
MKSVTIKMSIKGKAGTIFKGKTADSDYHIKYARIWRTGRKIGVKVMGRSIGNRLFFFNRGM